MNSLDVTASGLPASPPDTLRECLAAECPGAKPAECPVSHLRNCEVSGFAPAKLRSVRFRTCETAKCPVSHLRNVRNAKCPVAKVGEGTAYAANDAVGRITDAVYDDAKKEVTAYTDV